MQVYSHLSVESLEGVDAFNVGFSSASDQGTAVRHGASLFNKSFSLWCFRTPANRRGICKYNPERLIFRTIEIVDRFVVIA